jgi:hypothetical protein
VQGLYVYTPNNATIVDQLIEQAVAADYRRRAVDLFGIRIGRVARVKFVLCECLILEDELHGARFFKLQKISNLKFQKNTEKIPECSQRISIPVYRFSSRNTMYSTLGKNNKIADLVA